MHSAISFARPFPHSTIIFSLSSCFFFQYTRILSFTRRSSPFFRLRSTAHFSSSPWSNLNIQHTLGAYFSPHFVSLTRLLGVTLFFTLSSLLPFLFHLTFVFLLFVPPRDALLLRLKIRALRTPMVYSLCRRNSRDCTRTRREFLNDLPKKEIHGEKQGPNTGCFRKSSSNYASM